MRFWEYSRQLRQEDQGSEIAEAALVMPIVFLLLLAIIWFGRAFNVYTTVTYAAREGAQVAVEQSCAVCGNNVPTAAAVTARVTQVLRASKINPSGIQSYAPSPLPIGGSCGTMSTDSDPSGITVYRNAQLNGANPANPPACGVVVSFQYPFTFFAVPFTSLGQQQVMLKADVQMQGEN